MIIKSLLDTDWYKITMAYALVWVLSRLGLPMPTVLYKFKCRNKAKLLPLIDRISKEVSLFKKLTFKSEEIGFIMKQGIFEPWFASFLRAANLNDVSVRIYQQEGEFHMDIEGPMFPAIFFEVPLLAIVNEIYFSNKENKGLSLLKEKAEFFREKHIRIVDFGTRRRFSRAWHDKVVSFLWKRRVISGTSNVFLANKYEIPVRGTFAHEWLQLWQALSPNLRDFQRNALDYWLLAFRGRLNIALSDIIGADAFFKDFDRFLANAYSGVRHDSGDPYVFVDKAVAHYESLDVDASTKTIMFSDGLDPRSVYDLEKYCDQKGIMAAFGVGTNLTNSTGNEPLQIVIKLAYVNGQSVIKLSDSPGKAMYEDPHAVARIKETFDL